MSTLKVNAIRQTAASSDTVTLAADGTCTAKITNNLSNRNKIINGSAIVNQRGNETGVNSSRYCGPDRYKMILASTGAVFTVNQSTESPDGFANSYHVDCTTADTSVDAASYVRFLTVLEGKDVQDFSKGTSSAKKAVLSFYAKTNKTGTYSVLYFDSDNNRQFNATYTVSDSNWNRYTIPIPADTTGAFNNDTNASLEIYFHLVAGSNITSGSLDTTWNSYTAAKEAAGHSVNFADSTGNDFYITGIQLEVDSLETGVATDFEHRSYESELAKCQRYYWQQDFTGTHALIAYGTITGGTSLNIGVAFPCEMRANPTATVTAASHFRINDWSHDEDANGYSSSATWKNWARLSFTKPTSNMTLGGNGYLNVSSSGGSSAFKFSSEL